MYFESILSFHFWIRLSFLIRITSCCSRSFYYWFNYLIPPKLYLLWSFLRGTTLTSVKLFLDCEFIYLFPVIIGELGKSLLQCFSGLGEESVLMFIRFPTEREFIPYGFNVGMLWYSVDWFLSDNLRFRISTLGSNCFRSLLMPCIRPSFCLRSITGFSLC